MARTEIQNELYPDCPIRNILARISDKWSILILFTLNQSELMRFNALQKNIPDTAADVHDLIRPAAEPPQKPPQQIPHVAAPFFRPTGPDTLRRR